MKDIELPLSVILVAPHKLSSGYRVSPGAAILLAAHGDYNEMRCPAASTNLVKRKQDWKI